MRVHHWNCATMCPYGGSALGGHGLLAPVTLVAHCLLVERPAGLLLVDTGLGTADLREPDRRLGSMFVATARPRLDLAECALSQVEKLGFRASDVRDIAVTHLDLDHAGGLSDFPEATVHVHDKERDAAFDPRSFIERERYKPLQWAHGPRWHATAPAPDGERWFGFEAVRAIDERDPDVLLIPLVGHTRGHAGIAVRDGDGWLLHCGDAYFHEAEMRDPPRCPAALGAYQKLLAVDEDARVRNQARLRALARDHAAEVTIFCAHSAAELARFTEVA